MKIALVIMFATGLLIYCENASGETFTLNQIYASALQENEEIWIAREDLYQSEVEKHRARSSLFPSVTLSGTYNRFPERTRDLENSTVLLQPQDSYGGEVTVRQFLYTGGKNRAGIRIAKQGIEVAEKNLNLASEALLMRVAKAFYGALKAQKNQESQQHNVERLLEHRRLAELRYKAGEVDESILLRSEAELARAQAELVVIKSDLTIKKRELQTIAGLPEMFEIEEPPLPEAPQAASIQLLEIALSNREDVARNELQERIALERVTLARGNFLPSLTLEGTYFNRDQEPRSTFFIKDSWVAGGRIDFPIFEGGIRLAELAQARSKLRQSRLETARLTRQIGLDVTQSYQTLEAVQKALESRQEQRRFATKNYEIVSKQFTFGLATNIDLLDANQTLIEAERDMIAATYDQHLAILDLQRSIGIFLPNVLETSQTRM